jgi:hypothetical protein
MRGGGGMARMPGGPMLGDLIFRGSQHDQNLSVVVRGRKLQPAGYEGGDDSLTVRFNCPMILVDKVVLTSRAYEWMEMQNVSPQPAPAAPTKVKVVPVKEAVTVSQPIRETAPSIAAPRPRG